MKWMLLPIGICSVLVAGCATLTEHEPGAAACSAAPGSALWARTELYFGMQKPDDSFTTNEEYQHFIDDEVSPQFKDGFTVYEGHGQYLDPRGRLWREPTKVLVLMYPQDRTKSAAIENIRKSYKTQFQQEAVMRVDGTACVAF
jgi:hypothetical protein